MNICLISQEYPPETNWGGIATYTQVLARELAATGHTVHVVALAEGSEHVTDDMGVAVHRVSRTPKTPFDPAKVAELEGLSHGILYFAQRVYEEVAAIHAASHLDVIEAPETCAQAVLTFLRLEGIVKLTRLHTPFFWVRHLNTMEDTPENLLRDRLEQLQTEISTAVSAPTKAMAKVVAEKWGIKGIDVIPNFFNLKTYTPDLSVLESHLSGTDYILFFGRLEHRKGVDVLAEALPEVLEAHPSIKVALIGSDSIYNSTSMKSHIEQQLERFGDRILFIDNIPHAALYPIIEKARFVLLPSLWENFPYTCIEAMSLGKTVIASDAGGFPEIIDHGKEGILCPPGDPQALKAAILEALKNVDLEATGASAKKKAQTFDTATVVSRIAEYYGVLEEKLHGFSADTPLRIGYVARHIPVPSETFVINEILALQSQGLDIFPVSLLPAQECHSILTSQFAYPILDLSSSSLSQEGEASRYFAKTQEIAREYGVCPKLTWQAALVAELVEKESIDHLHAHFATESAFVAMVAAKAAGITFSFTAHAYDIFRQENTGTIQRDTPDKRLDILLRNTELGVTISEFNKRHILSITNKALADRISVVHCGIDLNNFNFSKRAGKSSVTFMTVGRFVEKKGYQFLIRAFKTVAQDLKDTKLRLIGEGPHRDAMIGLCRELGIETQVQFLGSLSSKEVATEMKRADVFVLPSVTAADGDMEGIPVSLMEASASGLPVISTLHSGISELVIHGVTGFLAAERDTDQLASYMLALASSPKLRHRMGIAGRKHVSEQFSLQGEAAKLKAAYTRMVSARRKSNREAANRHNALVDIIMPTYSTKIPLMKRAIESIQAQELTDWNLIIVKDGGDVDIAPLIADFNDPRIKLYEVPHAGKPTALNFALSKVTARYIAYLDDDDIWYPNHLQVAISHMMEHNVRFLHTDAYEVTVVREDGVLLDEMARKLLHLGVLTDLTMISISHINAVHETSLAQEAGQYDVNRRFFIDWDMFIRLASISKPCHLAIPTCEHYIYVDRNNKQTNTITGLHKNDPELSRRMQREMYAKALPLLTPDGFVELIEDWWRKEWQVRQRDLKIQELTQTVAKLELGVQPVLIEQEPPRALPVAEPEDKLRVLAFFLPQYHPIPENDEWWGKGFTEWRNVSKAKPLFKGHYQPHVPADLSFYDLRLEETRIAQAELARQYGVHGFCYYHYWFNGKRLLETPLEAVLKSGKPDFPFCICWANENWTRRWDGEEQHVLMQQVYSEEDDRNHIRDLFRVFRDPRYIRVNGKPLFLVYRTENIPNPKRTAEIWREEARAAGIGELYLVRVESIGGSAPASIGFDASLEFAPDWQKKGPRIMPDRDSNLPGQDLLNEVYKKNYVHHYDNLADEMMAKPGVSYKRFRCVTPSWDNSARRQEGANIFVGSTPEKYRQWLEHVVSFTKATFSGDERIAFVNAWNEWAEGNHLEPDQKFGRAYLEATKTAIDGVYTVPRQQPSVQEVDLSPYQQEVHALRQQLAAAQKENGELLSAASMLKVQLAEMEELVAAREMRINDLIKSASWRVTEPLRRAYEVVQNIQGKK